MRLSGRLYLSTSLCGLLAVAGPAVAADMGYGKPVSSASLPAVSGVNGKFDVRGGILDGETAGFAVGSLSLPVSHAFGVQLDAMAGSIGGAFATAFGAHGFWRDPRFGLFGIYGDAGYDARLGGLTVGHLAAEAEFYLGRVTLSGLAGNQFGEAGTGFFGKAEFAFYLTDNFKLYGGYNHQPALADRGILGGEALLTGVRASGISIFGEGRLGGGDVTAMAGLRLYSGASKSLIDRHRRDDPTDHFAIFSAAVAGVMPLATGDEDDCETGYHLESGSCVLNSG